MSTRANEFDMYSNNDKLKEENRRRSGGKILRVGPQIRQDKRGDLVRLDQALRPRVREGEVTPWLLLSILTLLARPKAIRSHQLNYTNL